MSENKKFMKYVLPSILSNFGMSCYILIDTIFLTRISEYALAGLNIILPIYELPMAIGSLFGIGSSALYAIKKAQGKAQEGLDYFKSALLLSAVTSILLMALILYFNGPLTDLLGADPDTKKLSMDYLKGYTVFFPAMIINYVATNFIRNDDDPALASFASIMGSVFNLIFDYLFISVFKWGMFGAAFASGASPLFSLLVCIKHFIKKKDSIRFTKINSFIKKSFELCKLGFSSFLSVMAVSLVTLAFNKQLLALGGNLAVTAYGIMVNLAVLVNCVINGVTQGVQPLFSECYGKNDFVQMKQYQNKTIMFIIASYIVSFGLTLLFPSQIISIFNPEGNLQLFEITRIGMIIYFSGFIFTGIVRYLEIYFVSTNAAFPASLLSVLCSGVVITPIVLVLPVFLKLIGVWLSYPISEMVIMLIGFVLLRSTTTK